MAAGLEHRSAKSPPSVTRWTLVLGLLLALVSASWGHKASAPAPKAGATRPQAGKRVGFDLDDTLFDTRYRTQAAVRDFAKDASTPELRRALRLGKRIENIGFDGAATAEKLGMSAATAKAFAKHWLRFFWTQKNFAHDRPIPELVAMAKGAIARGQEVYFITGRTRRGKSATLQQLRDAGLDVDAKHLYLKPNVGVRTLDFKLAALKDLDVPLYATDSSREVDALFAIGKKSLWIDFPVKAAGAKPPTVPTRRIVIRDQAAPRHLR